MIAAAVTDMIITTDITARALENDIVQTVTVIAIALHLVVTTAMHQPQHLYKHHKLNTRPLALVRINSRHGARRLILLPLEEEICRLQVARGCLCRWGRITGIGDGVDG